MDYNKTEIPEYSELRIEYLVSTVIPPECMENSPCRHDKKPIKREQNPV